MKFTISTNSSSNKTFYDKYRNTIFFRRTPFSQVMSRGKLVSLFRNTMLKGMKNNKSPRNDRLKKEFYETFQNEIKEALLKTAHYAKASQQLSISWRKAIIKLLEKKRFRQEHIKN